MAEELRRTHPPRIEQGFTVFFTGLSGSGKSTIANALLVKFLELGGRPVTLLDGDIVRKHLSSELGFSKEHRDINIRRIGFVASEITKNGGIALCAPIAPYDAVRKEVRGMIEPYGGFVLVHLATPLEVCEERDRKGMYAKARAGILKEFTGISDPYEAPRGRGGDARHDRPHAGAGGGRRVRLPREAGFPRPQPVSRLSTSGRAPGADAAGDLSAVLARIQAGLDAAVEILRASAPARWRRRPRPADGGR